jgi:hypothetical protein
MRYTRVFWPLLSVLALAACGDNAPPQYQRRVTATDRDEPVNPAFIGRPWISTTQGAARGTIMVFLPDRTLLMASCSEPFRLVDWGVVGDNIRWRENAIPTEATVELPTPDTLTLRIAGQQTELTFVAGWAPYVCPKT